MTQFARRTASLALFLVGFGSVSAGAEVANAVLDDLALGRSDAPVTIVEYASFTCPHCARFHSETLPKLKQAYIETGKVKLVFREFPFDEAGVRAAMLARCAGPARYHAFVDVLFQQQRSWATAEDPARALTQLAKLGGMSEAEVTACFADRRIEEVVLQNRLRGEKEGVTSTPTFFIDGEKHAGALPFAEFEKLLKPLVPASLDGGSVIGSAQAQTPQPSQDRPPAETPGGPQPGAPTQGSSAGQRPDTATTDQPRVPPEAAPMPAAEQPGGISGWTILGALVVVVVLAVAYWAYRRRRSS